MPWGSILPPSFGFIETWIARLFLLLGIIAIGPWLLVLLYDAVLYMFRTVTYELPYVGGRARNRPRPRAPGLRSTAFDGQGNPSERLKRRRTESAPGNSDYQTILDDN